MSSGPQPAPVYDRTSMVERGVSLVQTITLRNVATLALLVAIAIPAYGAYLFFTDRQFRLEWVSSVKLRTTDDAPCLIYDMADTISPERTIIAGQFKQDGTEEFLIGKRAIRVIDKAEAQTDCEAVHKYIRMIRGAIDENERLPPDERGPQRGTHP